MSEYFDTAIKWLLCASAQVGPKYFRLPEADRDPADAKYRERVYCYELYHRWRCHWAETFPYTLNGEVDKASHLSIHGGFKPDFLVHDPGEMDNLLIVEVKPCPPKEEMTKKGNLRQRHLKQMADDLEKLTTFRRDLKSSSGKPGNYQGAIFWLYGLEVAEWPNFKEQLLRKVGQGPAFDPSLVSCYIHEHAGRQATRVHWE